MRNILMRGTAQALSPYANGVTAWVPELSAYYLASTGELTYVSSKDVVSAERVLELESGQLMQCEQAWANLGRAPRPGQKRHLRFPPAGTEYQYGPHDYMAPAIARKYG